MKKIKRIFIIFLILFVVIFSIIITIKKLQEKENDEITIETLSKYGSRGDEVRTIQTKLKRWGYYSGNVDGIYGNKTVEAVKYFQRKNNLAVDGIAGTKTLKAMGIYSSSTSSSTGASNSSDLNILSKLIYAESRGVIYQKGAFDAVSDGQINLTPNSTAKKAAQDAINGWDPSNGAIYYFNPATATNKWIWSRPVTVTIGKHRFCK